MQIIIYNQKYVHINKTKRIINKYINKTINDKYYNKLCKNIINRSHIM